MTRFLVIKNWERLQHYKDRDPPWVKLYRDALTSEVWVLGSDCSRLLQIASTLLAARYNNRIPLNYKLLTRVASLDCSESEFDSAVAHLVEHSFLEIQADKPKSSPPAITDASKPLADCPSETETETEKTRPLDPRKTFLTIQEIYPAGTYRLNGWQQAEREYNRLIDFGTAAADLLEAVRQYTAQQTAIGKVGSQFVMSPATFFDLRESHWKGPFPLPKDPGQIRQDANIAAGQAWLAQERA